MHIVSRWAPSGKYRLPMPVLRMLQERLRARTNKAAAERAHRLAGFLAQMHAATGRAFFLDRRKIFLAHGRRKGAEAATPHSPDNPDTDGLLDLTLDQIRAAIEILEYIGFVRRTQNQGRAYRKLAAGGYMRAAVQWILGAEFERIFSWCRKSPRYSSTSSLVVIRQPSEKELITNQPIYGGVRPRVLPPSQPVQPIVVNPALEAVLAKLAKGAGAAFAAAA